MKTTSLARSFAFALPVLLTATAVQAAPTTAVPPELLGKWSWTTFSGSNYVDPYSGRITDNAGGMSVAFNFQKNGRYTFFFYTRRRTYGLVTEATSTHEGTVTFAKDKFTLKPSKGHYKGSSTGGKRVNRPMTRAEMKKNTVYLWKWVTKNGQKQLMIGPSSDSLSHFKKAN